MEEKKISRVAVARALGQSPQSISMKLQGVRPTSVSQIAIIAGLLNVSAVELLGDDSDYVLGLDERELVQLFRLLTNDQKVSFLSMLRSVVGSNSN